MENILKEINQFNFEEAIIKVESSLSDQSINHQTNIEYPSSNDQHIFQSVSLDRIGDSVSFTNENTSSVVSISNCHYCIARDLMVINKKDRKKRRMAQSTNKKKKLFVLTSMIDEGLDGANEIKLFRANSRLNVAKYMLLTKCKLNIWAKAYGIIQKFDRNNDDLDETARLLLISIDQSEVDGDSEAKVILDRIKEPKEIDELDGIKETDESDEFEESEEDESNLMNKIKI